MITHIYIIQESKIRIDVDALIYPFLIFLYVSSSPMSPDLINFLATIGEKINPHLISKLRKEEKSEETFKYVALSYHKLIYY